MWITDVRSGTHQRVTSGPETEAPIGWSGDSQRILWRELGLPRVVIRDLRAAGIQVLDVPESAEATNSAAWSPDGRYLLFAGTDGRADLRLIDLTNRTGAWLTESPFPEEAPRFSPDASAIAYASTDTGQSEVYVRALQAPGARQVSIGGGGTPMWRGDGREIVYVAPDGTFMSVAVTPRPALAFAPPKPLFRVQPFRSASDTLRLDMTPDGQRFLIQVEPDQIAPLVMVDHWPGLLKAP